MKAKDIMTKNVYTVMKDSSVFDAMILIIDKNIGGLPVVNEDKELVGMLSERDVLEILNKGFNDPSLQVGQFATKTVVSFSPEEEVSSISEMFKRINFRMVPIVENKKLVGVIARKDIIRSILNKAFDVEI